MKATPLPVAMLPLEPRTHLSVTPAVGFTFTGDEYQQPKAIATDARGNVFVAGGFSGATEFNPSPRKTFTLDPVNGQAFVAKYSPDGALFWVRQFSSKVAPVHLATDAAGTVYAAGHFSGAADFNPDPLAASPLTPTVGHGDDAFLLRLDASGNFLFANKLSFENPDRVTGLAVDAAGYVYLAGHSDAGDGVHTPSATPHAATIPASKRGAVITPYHEDGQPNPEVAFAAKYTAKGKNVYLREFGDGEHAIDLAGLAVDAAGNAYVAGRTAAGGVDFDPSAGGTVAFATAATYLLKLDAAGDYAWASALPSNPVHVADLATDAAGNLYVAGAYSTTVDFNPSSKKTFNLTSAGGDDVFLAKYTPAGALAFARSIGSGGDEFAGSVAVDPASGHALVAGTFEGKCYFNPGAGTYRLYSAGEHDAFVARFTAAGTFSEALRVGNATGTPTPFLAAAPDGSLFVCGEFYGDPYDFDPGAGAFTLAPDPDDTGTDAYLVRLVLR